MDAFVILMGITEEKFLAIGEDESSKVSLKVRVNFRHMLCLQSSYTRSPGQCQFIKTLLFLLPHVSPCGPICSSLKLKLAKEKRSTCAR